MPAQNKRAEAVASPLTTPVEIDRNLIAGLRSEAQRRSTTVPRLINDLLALTVKDKLTTAILDDDR
jgi:hypothetical protein